MYFLTKDNLIWEAADDISLFSKRGEDLQGFDVQELKNVTMAMFMEDKNPYKIIDGVVRDVSDTEEYQKESFARKNEEIKQQRASLYASHIDPLIAELNRKRLLGLLEDGEEAELLQQIADESEKIKADNPYLPEPEIAK